MSSGRNRNNSESQVPENGTNETEQSASNVTNNAKFSTEMDFQTGNAQGQSIKPYKAQLENYLDNQIKIWLTRHQEVQQQWGPVLKALEEGRELFNKVIELNHLENVPNVSIDARINVDTNLKQRRIYPVVNSLKDAHAELSDLRQGLKTWRENQTKRHGQGDTTSNAQQQTGNANKKTR